MGRQAPEGLVGIHTNLHFKDVDRGGHFAAWEESGLFSTEVQAAFRSVRNQIEI
jgi:hypothetical protein